MKKLIVLATLAALPAAAMADVVISGNLAVGVVNTKESGKGSLTTEDRTSGELKFAGTEDLGNGLKSIWQVATRINLADTPADGNNNNWASRESFVGLKGDFGTLRLGNILDMKTAGAMAVFENNSATFASAIYDQGARINNTVAYTSPSISGLTVTAQHSFGKTKADEEAKAYRDTLGLAYEGEGFAVSYDGRFTEQASNKTAKLHELNASASFDALTVLVGAARNTDDNGRRNGYGIAATYELGNITPKIGFWKEGDLKTKNNTVNSGHKAYAAGVEYALSKRTRAGVELAKANFDDKATADVRTATVYLGTKF